MNLSIGRVHIDDRVRVDGMPLLGMPDPIALGGIALDVFVAP
jgi:hypothetical protein